MARDERMYAHGPYRYITKHGIGPGTLPKDVNLVKWEDLDNYRTAIWTDRFLTTQELEDYDIYPETIQECKQSVFESLTDDDNERLAKYADSFENEADFGILLDIFNLIDDENKSKLFDLVDTLFNGKKLIVFSDTVVEEPESYTRRLLGDI